MTFHWVELAVGVALGAAVQNPAANALSNVTPSSVSANMLDAGIAVVGIGITRLIKRPQIGYGFAIGVILAGMGTLPSFGQGGGT